MMVPSTTGAGVGWAVGWAVGSAVVGWAVGWAVGSGHVPQDTWQASSARTPWRSAFAHRRGFSTTQSQSFLGRRWCHETLSQHSPSQLGGSAGGHRSQL